MGRLEGKVAIITGSTAGIGRASAELMAKEGAAVVVTGRREALGQEVVDGIKANGGEACFIKLDVFDESSIENLIVKTEEMYGKIDILVNNVGGGKNGMVHTLTSEDFDHVVAIDLKSFFLATKFVLPIMLKNGGGSIVNVSSAGINNIPLTTSLYQMCKAGVNQFSACVAKEYAAEGIRCNVVAPGYTDTDIFTSLDEEGKKRVAQTLNMKRFATAMEVANAILFLASDESSYCTGRVLDVSGGMGL
ncbi:MAG: SDR family oxidoreductase [Ruminiclostridium sp.]|nr:SDR family oxidoreductase [Ruminiclostridium sp.]MBQ9932285.1 SDR family oxidoreductase [Ruminiclostridium sp.]